MAEHVKQTLPPVERTFESDERAIHACPDTHAALEVDGDALVSPETGRRFPMLEGGIPCFLRYDSIEREQISEELKRLNELADSDGWLEALEAVHGHDPIKLRYTTDVQRHCYHDLLPIDETSRVLEIGTGLGNGTAALMKRVKALHGLEVVPAQAFFVRKRCIQQGGDNVFLACGGDDGRLPYAGDSFNVVVMNLVFEWVGSREEDLWPEEIQRRFLAEALRVLVPGGTLYLSTKNRYALRYLVGRPDEHSKGLRFASVLPRGILKWRLARKGLKNPPGLLHSHTALEGMLVETGFDPPETLWAVPDMRWPENYIRTDPKSLRDARRSTDIKLGGRVSDRVMRVIPRSMVKHIAPGLVFLAKRPEK